MPIDIDRFRTESADDLRASGPTDAEVILAFLTANADKAFTPAEIRDATGVADGSGGVVLARMEDDALLDHRGEYWAVADAADAATTLNASATARAAAARFGNEDPAEWGPGGEARGGK